MGVARKRKEQAEDIYKGTADIEFEQDGSVGLGAILADGQKIKNNLYSFRYFSGKADSVKFNQSLEPFLRNSKF